MAKKYIYFFGAGKADGNGKMKDLLGGKGAGLAEMSRSGVPVPPGFTITTDACKYYYAHGHRVPPELEGQIKSAMEKLQKVSEKNFGDPKNPLLVSVRSGAKFSMPGMMDTILNLGLNDAVVEGLITLTSNPRFVWDSYRRFVQMFGSVVMGIDKSEFEHILKKKKSEKGVTQDTDLTAKDLQDLVSSFKVKYREITKEEFPQDPWKQMIAARNAVFKSWNNDRAISYRRLNKISEDLGTAVNIQTMVFGNMGIHSATGVGFTRNPASGNKEFFGEYLINAQGEDVVAGIRTPKPIKELGNEMPQCYAQLRQITSRLEKHYRDMQDFEFTIEREKLYMLQTRTGKRTGIAAVNLAVEMAREKLISRSEAVMRVEPDQLAQLLAPVFDEREKKEAIGKGRLFAKGINAGPGAASGRIAFTAVRAVELAKEGPVVLVRPETNPDDIEGMDAAVGILTAIGGRTSHAAVVARGMGKPCVVGCSILKINEAARTLSVDGQQLKEGEPISIDGFTGEVLVGKIATLPSEVIRVLKGEMKPQDSELYQIYKEFMRFADEVRRLKTRANADIPRDAKIARLLGAEGIGLCRTEHMFFAEERLPLMQKMILANNVVERKKALDQLLPYQKDDFKGLFREMRGFPVTIRTLDPPLHEFLPKTRDEAEILSKKIGIPAETIWSKSKELHEFNPMLGHRGCRLGITYPEITEMQVQAIIGAACELAKEKIRLVPEIMIPLVGHKNELKHQKDLVIKTATETMKSYGVKVNYMVGTMIEVPRAALVADTIAEEAEFFSFGTNDLTQMGFGFSRDDAGKFIPAYLAEKILKTDPFQTIDQEGIGKLMQMATRDGRRVKKDLKIGICGEHGGEPESVKFCHRIGLNYVSCSPYRIPIARLAAAQAVLEEKQKSEYTSK